MKTDEILMCLIAFILGYLVAGMLRGNGLAIGGECVAKPQFANSNVTKRQCSNRNDMNCTGNQRCMLVGDAPAPVTPPVSPPVSPPVPSPPVSTTSITTGITRLTCITTGITTSISTCITTGITTSISTCITTSISTCITTSISTCITTSTSTSRRLC